MPKAKDYANKAKPIIIKRKFRIGGRKGGKGAFGMTTKDLITAFKSPNHKRSHSKIAAVLRSRGIDVYNLAE